MVILHHKPAYPFMCNSNAEHLRSTFNSESEYSNSLSRPKFRPILKFSFSDRNILLVFLYTQLTILFFPNYEMMKSFEYRYAQCSNVMNSFQLKFALSMMDSRTEFSEHSKVH